MTFFIYLFIIRRFTMGGFLIVRITSELPKATCCIASLLVVFEAQLINVIIRLNNENHNNKNLLIIATSIGSGLGVTFSPEFISQLPEALKMIFSSGISTGTIVALILNKILKKEGEHEEFKESSIEDGEKNQGIELRNHREDI